MFEMIMQPQEKLTFNPIHFSGLTKCMATLNIGLD